MSDESDITPIKVIFDLISEKRRLEDLVHTVYVNRESPVFIEKAVESYLERYEESVANLRLN